MRGAPTARGPAHRERGIFSFAELLLAIMVLALSATATAYWVETVNNLTADADEQLIGAALVKSVESVLQPLAFREPGTTGLGPESGETLSEYDDVDDFHGLLASPPFDGQLEVQPDLTDWSVTVTVIEVEPGTLEPLQGSDLRQVRVRAIRRERVVAESWWLRARSPLE